MEFGSVFYRVSSVDPEFERPVNAAGVLPGRKLRRAKQPREVHQVHEVNAVHGVHVQDVIPTKESDVAGNTNSLIIHVERDVVGDNRYDVCDDQSTHTATSTTTTTTTNVNIDNKPDTDRKTSTEVGSGFGQQLSGLNYEELDLDMDDYNMSVVDEYSDVPGLIESPSCESLKSFNDNESRMPMLGYTENDIGDDDDDDNDDDDDEDDEYNDSFCGSSKRVDFRLHSEEDNLWMNSDYITSVQSTSIRTDTLDSTSDFNTHMVVDEKDTLFGLGIMIGIPSILGDINGMDLNSDLNSYICTLEGKQFDEFNNNHTLNSELPQSRCNESDVEATDVKVENNDNVESNGSNNNISTDNSVETVIKEEDTNTSSSSSDDVTVKRPRGRPKSKSTRKKSRRGKKAAKRVTTGGLNDDNKFICAECGKGFPRKSNHDSHIRMHLKVKPHQCNYCEKAFVRRSDLNRHERSLHWKTNFRCIGVNWGCGHVYSRKDGLRKHWKTSQGIDCLKGFIEHNNLGEYDPESDIEKIIELTSVFK